MMSHPLWKLKCVVRIHAYFSIYMRILNRMCQKISFDVYFLHVKITLFDMSSKRRQKSYSIREKFYHYKKIRSGEYNTIKDFITHPDQEFLIVDKSNFSR